MTDCLCLQTPEILPTVRLKLRILTQVHRQSASIACALFEHFRAQIALRLQPEMLYEYICTGSCVAMHWVIRLIAALSFPGLVRH